MKYRIERDVTNFHGSQTFECDADSKEEAMKKFEKGDDIFIEQDIEVTNLSDVTIEEIYEWQPEPEEEPEPKYCTECGGQEDFAYLYTYANGDEWKCGSCGKVFIWPEDKGGD